ncbi:MAG: hypothetical protein ABW200_15685 [Hyphomicrobiaceae bacterium]
MAADGTWNLVMNTPIGERKATLTLQGSGALTGSLAAEGNTTPILDGQETGNTVSFKAAITNPMPLTLEFSATIDGAKIAGTVGAGAIGSWPFSGTKA